MGEFQRINMRDFALLVRQLTDNDFVKLERELAKHYGEVPHNCTIPETGIDEVEPNVQLTFDGVIPTNDIDMSYVDTMEALGDLLDLGTWTYQVEGFKELEPNEAYELKLKGYRSSVIELGDFDQPADGLETFEILSRLSISGNRKVSAKTPKGVGLTFVKGSIQEDTTRACLDTESNKEEFDRFVKLTSFARRSAIHDIAERSHNGKCGPYSFLWTGKEEVSLLLAGIPIQRFSPKLLPKSFQNGKIYNRSAKHLADRKLRSEVIRNEFNLLGMKVDDGRGRDKALRTNRNYKPSSRFSVLAALAEHDITGPGPSDHPNVAKRNFGYAIDMFGYSS